MSVDLLQRRLDRERKARREAERLLEEKSLELFSINEELRCVASILDRQRQQLQEALDREKEVNGLQRQFVSMVSHEFRTPLAIIDGSARKVLRRAAESLGDRECGALQKIRNAVVRMTELMESMLSVARLEEGHIQFAPGPCSLATIIQDMVEGYQEIHADRNINLELEQLPQEIVADHKLLRQVFSNLLSNAVKYSPPESSVWIEGRTDDQGKAVIAVRDEGVGIPKAELAKLFDRFFRASTSVGIAGTGIGLHLAAHLVQLHQGSIEVESSEHQGATFRVLLPIEAPAGADPQNVMEAVATIGTRPWCRST